MIVFFGYGDDPPLVRAVRAAADRGLDHLVVDQRATAGTDLVLAGDEDGGLRGAFVVDGRRVELERVTAVYARPLSPVPAPGDPRRGERDARLVDLTVEWLDTAPVRVVNRPVAMASNSSKPFQAQLIAEAGFAVPETLVSSDPDAVRAFADAHGAVVFKSVSGVRSIVRRLDRGYLDRLDRVRNLPTQFQALVPGVDIRVHVVGERVFATAVETAATDYRYAGRDGEEAVLTATALPPEVAERCVRLAAALDLPLAGLDLRRTPDGVWVCFEVNPMPGYSFFESHTGQPISESLVDHLAGAGEGGTRWSSPARTAPTSRAS
ncbi:hypothetical protein FHX74_000010 [Friedmanniella endophytica]|uniref:ATP-grasp domain-containing protein n=1 Tax=Microlunatus kandeliicorticis TaxID=1759536 RepID=A0A7W3INP0_9ACTN|nr:alpha-L-glutamate ligase [Microlunatus kandeliicorticis]MBA8792416.1 hypothetical protein [Microlunatus kandeliicorticis]